MGEEYVLPLHTDISTELSLEHSASLTFGTVKMTYKHALLYCMNVIDYCIIIIGGGGSCCDIVVGRGIGSFRRCFFGMGGSGIVIGGGGGCCWRCFLIRTSSAPFDTIVGT